MWKPLDCKIAFAGALALAISLGASPVTAQEAQETQTDDNANPPTVLICKQIAVTGTRIKREYCLTEEDWEEIRYQSRVALERLRNVGQRDMS